MKVLYHHRTRATDAQGVHILEMVNAFRNLGHQVEIASLVETERPQPDGNGEPAKAGWSRFITGFPLACELLQLGYNLIGFPWLLWKVLFGRVDLIYERYALFNFCGVLTAWVTRKPIVVEVNSPFAIEQHREKAIRAVRFANWMERAICNAATKVIVVSGPLRRMLIENGVSESKIVVMPNGVNIDHLSMRADTSALRNSLGIGGKVVIGFVGWFRKWHGLEFLVDVFRQSDLPRRGAVLLLIGDGPAMPELQEVVKKHCPAGSVVLTGAIPHEKIPTYLGLIDIAVQPAANEYCCPMKILEYMALSKPIVAPKQENIEELLRDGEGAMLFTPGRGEELYQALLKLVMERETRVRLGKSALEAIHKRGFLWSTNAEAVVRMAWPDSGSGDWDRRTD